MSTPSTPTPTDQRSTICVSPEFGSKLCLKEVDATRLFPKTFHHRTQEEDSTLIPSTDGQLTNTGRPLRKCRLRSPPVIDIEVDDSDPRPEKRKRGFDKHLTDNAANEASAPSNRKSTAQVPIVTDDDDDDWISPETTPDGSDNDSDSNSEGRTGKRAKTKTSNAYTNPSPKLKPLPLKLSQSQIHSKRYPFPNKLYDLMEKATLENSKVVSWSSDGTTFVVHDHARFEAEFLPTYFGHHQFRSFDRQLNFWYFETISPKSVNNTSFGGKTWKHPFFQRGRRDLLSRVIRKPSRSSPKSPKRASPKSPKTAESPTAKASPKADKVKSSLAKITPEIKAEETEDTIPPLESTASKALPPPPPPPRIVSPTASPLLRGARSIRKSVLKTIEEALDILAGSLNDADSDAEDATIILDEPILTLSDTEWLHTGEGSEEILQESFDPASLHAIFSSTKDIEVFDGDNRSNGESSWDYLFDGKSFHEIEDSIIDVDTSIEEAELFLKIIVDDDDIEQEDTDDSKSLWCPV